MHRYRADIDGLRAIAVTLVVAFHAFPTWIKGGFIGVDIFFVISGYLITGIINEDIAKGQFSISKFYERRIRRIFPALLFVLTVTLLFGWYVLLGDEFARLGRHVLAGIIFISNLTLWSELGYFDSAGETKPLLHLWSLGIEEQFYLVWPLLFVSLSRKINRPFVLVCILILISFSTNVYLVYSDASAAFFVPITRFWELLTGALIACTHTSRIEGIRDVSRRLGHITSVIGAMLLVLSVLLIDKNRLFPGWWAILPVLGTALLILSGPESFFNSKILSFRPLVWIGLISYPLYLWHWPLLSYLWIMNGGLPSREAKLAAVLLSLTLGWLTFRYIERPFRFGSLRSHSTTLLLSCSLGLMAFSVIVISGNLAPRISSFDIQKLVAASNDKNFLDGFSIIESNNNTFHVIDTGSADITLFIGDSHVMQYGPRLRDLAKEHGRLMRTTYLAVLGGCPPIPNVYDEHNEPACSRLRSEAINMAVNPNVKSIVIGGCWNCYFIHQAQNLPPSDTNSFSYYFDNSGSKVSFRGSNGSILAKEQLALFIKELVLLNKPVYLLLDNPYSPRLDPRFYFEGNRLYKNFSTKPIPPSISSEEAEITLHNYLNDRATSNGAFVLDPRRKVCDINSCSLLDSENNIIYQDRNHFTSGYVRRNADFIDRTVLQ